MSLQENKSRLRLRISAVAETQLRAGHPWVFSDSIRELNREGAAGELEDKPRHRAGAGNR